MRVNSKKKVTKVGVPFEHVIALDCETAATVFRTPNIVASQLEKRCEKLVARWNKENGPEEKKGQRVRRNFHLKKPKCCLYYVC